VCDRTEIAATAEGGRCNNRLVPLDSAITLRAATSDDAAFIVEMTRHACVIEDCPLPDPDSEEVHGLLPAPGEVRIVAADAEGACIGAVWTLANDPPLRVDGAGAASPELCIAVAPGKRGSGVGGALIDALFVQKAATLEAMCTNIHVRNPAQRRYERTGFQVVGRGRGRLSLAMIKDLRLIATAGDVEGTIACPT
jgi:ribosomal protein S18 acetylase RimI-like enzyme